MSGETEFWTKKSFSRLNKVQLVEATNWLCTSDKDLSLIVKQFGIPPLWQRPEGFCTLIFLILDLINELKLIINPLVQLDT